MQRTTASDFSDGHDVSLTAAWEWVEILARMGAKHARLSRLAAGLPRARSAGRSVLVEVEKERGRIARELHAGAGQPLAGIKISLEQVESWRESNPGVLPPEVEEAVVRIHRLAESALGQVRAVSHRLHPPDWQNLSATDAIRLLVRESGVTDGCRANIRIDELPEEPDHSVRVVLYRCAQECISNVLRHSGASTFSLSLSSASAMIQLTIHDNGRGIPEDAATKGGIGLLSIREHARSVGGAAVITSGSDGTTIQISLPFMEE